MDDFINILAGIMIVGGAVFALSAAVGLLRFPDVYARMHAASKAGSLGAGLMFLAVAVTAADLSVALRAISGLLFFLLTAPISAHLLARAAYYVGYKPWSGTIQDDLAGKYSSSGDSISCRGVEVTMDKPPVPGESEGASPV